MEIKSNGFTVLIDDEDAPLFDGLKIHVRRHWLWKQIEVLAYGRGFRGYVHRRIMGIRWVDHIDGDRLNNRRANLREATPQQNSFNRKKLPGFSSKYKGVCWNKNLSKWLCQIEINGGKIYLGYFKDEAECAKAYDKKAKELFGEFARLNFPDSAQSQWTATGMEGRIEAATA